MRGGRRPWYTPDARGWGAGEETTWASVRLGRRVEYAARVGGVVLEMARSQMMDISNGRARAWFWTNLKGQLTFRIRLSAT